MQGAPNAPESDGGWRLAGWLQRYVCFCVIMISPVRLYPSEWPDGGPNKNIFVSPPPECEPTKSNYAEQQQHSPHSHKTKVRAAAISLARHRFSFVMVVGEGGRRSDEFAEEVLQFLELLQCRGCLAELCRSKFTPRLLPQGHNIPRLLPQAHNILRWGGWGGPLWLGRYRSRQAVSHR